MTQPNVTDSAWVMVLCRWTLGLMFFFAGTYKFVLGPLEYARELSVMTHAVSGVPPSLWWAGGYLTPFFELSTGVLLILGLWTRPVLRALAVVMAIATLAYGLAALYQPVGPEGLAFSPVNDYLLSRIALLVVLLFAPRETDRYSLDSVLNVRPAAA